MKPYYEHAGMTIYHGDCRELLQEMPRVNAVITDPPYGTGWVLGGGTAGEFKARHEKPAWDVFTTDWLDLVNGVPKAVFCPVNRAFDLVGATLNGAVLYYKKTNPRPNGPNREAVVCCPIPYQISQWEYESYNGDNPHHPCQKPEDVMRWIIRGMSEKDQTVLDPFMGSGTTLVAAKNLGRKAIGIEIEEKYCEIAANRLAQEVFSFEEVAQ
jgi:DNA modification methylase